jgi:hypothetical protein
MPQSLGYGEAEILRVGQLAVRRIVSGRPTDLGENLATQAMTNLAERGSLGVREHKSAFQVVFQDAVFGGQIFVPGQQLLVHRPCDVGQDAGPMHNGLVAPIPVVAISPQKMYRTASCTAMLAVNN